MDSFDLLVVSDATGSMGSYLNALRSSIPEILALAKLSGAFRRLGVLAYKDYGDAPDIVAWSEWDADLTDFVQKLVPSGGGDYPEAAKTALIRGLQAVDKDFGTIILWFADAPPHHCSCSSHNNDVAEMKAFPEGATDWVKLCYTAVRRKCTVFCFTPSSMDASACSFYTLLSELTGGLCISSKANSSSSSLISRLTLGVIMQWMGQPSDLEVVIKETKAQFSRYEVSSLTANPKPTNETSGSRGYLPPPLKRKPTDTPLLPILEKSLQVTDVPRGPLATEPSNLAKRFGKPEEGAYRNLVYESLSAIIESNVHALTYNPIFGQLWRAVCKDTSESKIQLLNAFSNRISKVTDPAQKAALQQWLEDSFDSTEEIEGIIAKQAPNTEMVYLDLDSDVELTRIELLEVSRSCYAGVLKKVATIFTHLKLVEPGVTLAPNQRSIPLSLPPRDFFRILPHLVVPGTLYPHRAAAITAILALVTGVPFLSEPATALLSTHKGKWLNIEIPENISFDCARLLLSAPEGTVLTKDEKKVYEAMRRYKLIELNLDSSIDAKLPWTPRKTKGVGDRKIQCRKCLIKRSVTIMSERQAQVCGMCIPVDGEKTTKDPQQFPGAIETESCWVECSTKTCRAQYVVEDVPALRIRPRCYYCRNNIPCPWLECSQCDNRVIVPASYRTPKDRKDFRCPACDSTSDKPSVPTVVSVETTTKELKEDNGVNWLGFSASKDVLEGKSAFKLFQAYGADVFGGSPNPKTIFQLTLHGKKVHNPNEVLAQVERRVGAGEVELGACALCFEERPKPQFVAACGRSGCAQKVDNECLREWYGKSEPGKLLNLMQLMCPFCRRKPTSKTLARYNRPAAALGGLQQAIDDRRFFYAWCLDCGFAKQAYERVCCEGDRVPTVTAFRCEDCSRRPPVGQGEKAAQFNACPRCEVMIEKIAGCNHITCQCGEHFCYVCGKAFALDKIYPHMAREHGGAFDDEGDDDY